MRMRHALVLTMALAAGCTASGAPEQQPAAEASPSRTPEGTGWRLVELGGQPVTVAQNASAPSLQLNAAEDRASGDTGCNSFFGEYELSGATLRFGTLASTRRACLDEAMNRQEGAYMRALESTRSWRISGDALILAGDAGDLARFSPQAAR
jgi:heat shock protein HslJ